MAGITRRQLLQAGAGAGAGMFAFGSNRLVRNALATRMSGELSDIQHVVILIQENRSFDHYFGTMPGVRGYSDKSVPQSIFEQSGYPVEGYGGVLMPYHPESGPVPGERCFPDITHNWGPQHESWNAGAMDSFVKAHLANDGPEAGPATMAYYERSDIPFYYALAEHFTLCDGYHCSVIGPTYPNRLYAVSGTLDPEGLGGGPLIETWEDIEALLGRFTWRTMPEQLQAAGITWKSYTGAELGDLDNVLEFFANFQKDPELKARGLEPTYPKDFVKDLAHRELPQVSWINTSALQTEHPGYSSAKVGEYVVANLIMRLHHHGYWDKTALFITWDENGGFFDHVAPPVPPPGTPGEYLTVPDITNSANGIEGPIGLGFRVPLIICSPFSNGGYLCSDTFDHTSLLRFLETRFDVEVPNLSSWRRETVGDLTSAFSFSDASTKIKKLPQVTLSPAELEKGACEKVTPLAVPPNSMPVEEEKTWKRPTGA